MACAGDVPTLETLAAVELLHDAFPDLAIRTVNVVDLMTLAPQSEHPHGLADAEFDAIFTRSTPVIFAYHGYPWLIHRLTYKRAIQNDLHVHGYREEGTTTTPFDMTVRNGLDRYTLAAAALERIERVGDRRAHALQIWRDRLIDHRRYVSDVGDDLPDIKAWRWRGFERA
jgi:xylulose-5-phosphate/fructose-6-phosphate phosphoketolase